MMDSTKILGTSSTNYPFLEPAILILAEVSALLAFSLMLVTCLCCYGEESKRFRRHNGSSRDTTHLDDLLSKPSLADPESAFSEAAWSEYRMSSHGRSFQSSSDERSSLANETVCLPAPSCDNKDVIIASAATITCHTTEQESLNVEEVLPP